MSDALNLMRLRHSVRQYQNAVIPQPMRTELETFVSGINEKSGLHVQILWEEPECFRSPLARYGHFVNCSNYVSMTGPKSDANLEEACGYFGEQIVLEAQRIGLNSCWAYLTHGKSKADVLPGEREVIVIALGIGAVQGVPHRSKPVESVSNLSDNSPEWFRRGMEAVLLAPTAVNQQKFYFSQDGSSVIAVSKGIGPCIKIDLGIAKYHFEAVAGKENFQFRDPLPA